MAWLLDLSNILGGFLLAAGLLTLLPQASEPVSAATAALERFRLVVAVVALVSAGYFLLVHLTEGPHLFHFEVVGLAVGLLLLRGTPSGGRRAAATRPTNVTQEPLTLASAVLGIIAIVVGLQGLITPN